MWLWRFFWAAIGLIWLANAVSLMRVGVLLMLPLASREDRSTLSYLLRTPYIREGAEQLWAWVNGEIEPGVTLWKART
jgi:hypothetical protein